MNNYMKRKWIVAVVVGVLMATSGIAYAYTQKQEAKSNLKKERVSSVKIDSSIKKEEMIKTVSPKQENQKVSFLGEVLSNKTVNIYPRRNGIVKDVYVDIGDKVFAGQTIASLLPVGVEGESAALIREKQTGLETAQRNLEVSESVAKTEIQKAQQKVESAQVDIETTSEDAQAKVEAVEAKFDKVSQDIESSKNLIKTIEESFARDIDTVNVNVSSYEDTLLVSVENILRAVMTIFAPEKASGGGALSESDLDSVLGIFDDKNRERLIILYSDVSLLVTEGSVSDDSLFEKASSLLSSARALVQATPNGAILSTQIDSYLSEIDTAKDRLVEDRGKLDVAKSSKDSLLAKRDKEVSVIERQIDVNLAELSRLEKELQAVEANTNKKVTDTKERLKNLIADKSNTEAKERSKIVAAKNQVDLKSSALNSTYVSKGDNKIVSSFTGIVSERFVLVGESVSPASPVVVLDNVNTYLAKKNPLEITFGIPEQYREIIDVGDEVEYWLTDNEDHYHKGTVTKKGTVIDPITRNISARASVEKGVNFANKASVRISFSLKTGFSLPSSALRKDEDGDFVWLLDSGVLKKHYVEVILKDGEMAYVKNDLNEEMQVIENPLDGWGDGMEINNMKTK